MNAGQIELAKSYITWMRRGNTLSLEGYCPGWENAARDGTGDDDTCAPSIGRVGRPTLRPHIVCPTLQNRELPPPASRNVRKLPDLKRENPSFAAMLIKYVNERFGGDAPKVYNAAHVNRKTYSAIVGNELRPVSKTTAVQFALALNLTRAEADEFIKSAGYALYEYEVYKCSFSFTMESPQRTGGQFRESSKSNVEAKYAASVSVYYYMNNGKWTVFKVIGSAKEYKAYRENNYNPLRRMCAPDDAVLIEKYR